MIETPAQILAHYADKDAADSFIAWRKIKKSPLTERAALMIARTLAEISAARGDPTEALDMAQEHGWLTVKPDWYWRIKNAASRNQQFPSERPAHRSDPAIEQIARLTGFGQTPGYGRH